MKKNTITSKITNKRKFLTVAEFLKNMKNVLKLKIVAGSRGIKRKITVAEVNRPGLALTGYFDYFAKRRIQVIGKVEVYYLRQLPPKERMARIEGLFKQKVPCIIIARQYTPPESILRFGNHYGS